MTPRPVRKPRLLAAALFAALPLLLTACDFEQVIDLDVPPYEPHLVVGGFPTPGEVFTVRLGRSASALAPLPTDPFDLYVDGARVALFDEDGVFIDSLASCFYCDTAPGSYISVHGVHPEPGHTYTLRAEAPGLPPAAATTRLPDPVPFSARFAGYGSVPPYSERTARLVVTLPDPPGVQTYGLWVLASFPGGEPPRPTPFHSEDPLLRDSFSELDVAVDVEVDPNIERIFGAAFFRDVPFADETREIEIEALLYSFAFEEIDRFTVVLSTLSADYVGYQQTLARQGETGDNPFAEPVRLHSNVEGGLGVFAGYTSSTVVLEVE